jgi:hypothetical protein
VGSRGCQSVQKSCSGRVLGALKLGGDALQIDTFFVKGSTSAVCRSGLLSLERVGSGTLVRRHQQSLSLRVHLPLVIVATKTVARTNLRHAVWLVYPDDEPSCVGQ